MFSAFLYLQFNFKYKNVFFVFTLVLYNTKCNNIIYKGEKKGNFIHNLK